jgi:hypothetical protein
MAVKRIFALMLLILAFAVHANAASTAQQVDFLLTGIEKDGDPCSGCKVYTYETGTTTAKATYLDRLKASSATNPIVLDSEGRAEVFADGLYKFVIKTAADTSYFDIDGLDYGATGAQFVTLSQYGSLEEAIADIGGTETVLIMDTTSTLNANLTIPTNVTLHVFSYDSIDLNGKTLTMNGGITAPPIEWIVGTGTFTGSPIVQFYDPTWTASTLTDSATPSYKIISFGSGLSFTNATLTNATFPGQPIISDFTNATHTHISNTQGGLLALGLRDTYRNLYIVNTTKQTVTITADEMLMQDSNDSILRVESFSSIANITESGAGGLDTGSEAADTWYYIWGIGNATISNSLLSASATDPTLPSGYTFKSLLGAVRNNSAPDADFEGFSQVNNQVMRDQALITTNIFDITDFSTDCISNDISDYVPSTVKTLSGNVQASAAGALETYSQISGNSSCHGGAFGYVSATTSDFSNFIIPLEGTTVYLRKKDTQLFTTSVQFTGWGY